MTKHFHSYLALGDSYTVGEGVAVFDSFPYQVVQMLRKRGYHFHAPEIVAKTGWTTFELADHLINHELNDHYDFVSLLVGVNNQYRGLTVEDFSADFEFLLKKAIHYTSNKKVVVLSIPDWGTTPFAEGRDRKAIAREIDEFNAAKKLVAEKNNVVFIDITTSQREDGDGADFITSDKLHPSGREYTKWATLVAEKFADTIR